MTTRRKPTLYFGIAAIADWLSVRPDTVTHWLIRAEKGEVPGTPTPDMHLTPGRIRGVPDRGWLLERRLEWEEWRASLPGRGAPGVPRPRNTSDKETPQ